MSTPAPGLVGRDDELQDLVDRLDGAHAGGVVIGLVGEPGVGKNPVLRNVASRDPPRPAAVET